MRRVAVLAVLGCICVALAVAVAVVGSRVADRAGHRAAAGDVEPTRLAPGATGSCGVELWAIKTLTDAQAAQVSLAAKPTTVVQLAALAPPASSTRTRRPAELQAWTVQATLTGYKLEADSDVHLVLDDGAGHSMIAEIPDPSCAQGSVVLAAISATRTAFEARYNLAAGCFSCLKQPVSVTGVGFFDVLHGQNGVAPNGIELHPVLALSFGGSPPPPPPPPPTTTTTVPDDAADELPGCVRYPGRIYYHHVRQSHCSAGYFTTP